MEEPGELELGGSGTEAGGDCGEFAARGVELAGGYGVPGEEGDVVLGAVVEDGFVLALGEVVLVLDADDGEDAAGLLDLGDVDFREAYVADLAGLLEVPDHAERVFKGDLGVDAVELPEGKLLELEVAEAHLDLLAEVGGTAERLGLGRGHAGEAGFGGDDYACGVGCEGLADEALQFLRAIGVGCVDEVDAEIEGSVEDGFGCGGIEGRAPGSVGDEAHGAVADAGEREVVGEEERLHVKFDACS